MLVFVSFLKIWITGVVEREEDGLDITVLFLHVCRRARIVKTAFVPGDLPQFVRDIKLSKIKTCY